MTVRELIQIDEQYHSGISESATANLKKMKIGFRVDDLRPSNGDVIDNILFNKILLANKVLSGNSDVRVPAWTTQAEFDRFIAKIIESCN